MEARDHPTTADYAAHQAYANRDRLDIIEQTLIDLHNVVRFLVAHSNFMHVPPDIEKAYDRLFAIVEEMRVRHDRRR